jgi:hypothetical protein
LKNFASATLADSSCCLEAVVCVDGRETAARDDEQERGSRHTLFDVAVAQTAGWSDTRALLVAPLGMCPCRSAFWRRSGRSGPSGGELVAVQLAEVVGHHQQP